jgi:O-acetyl-ADP-ribose deacetylase (regulator of RNase III)
MLEECKHIRATEWPDGLPTGKAVITSGGNLKARHVIHTVGPVWREGNHGEAKLLTDAYRNCLGLAADKGLATVAFPSISTGAYGYPIEQASRIAIATVKEFLENVDKLDRVVFVLFSKHDYSVYVEKARDILGDS